ncbi:MAG: DUF4026 domain-containing protein [Planctomycetota bacterium]|nr:DUF4026 domain-containing protein [Planctomycetota bacterium]
MHSPSEPSGQCEPPCGDPWRLPEQEPTNLLALWSDHQPPTKTEVITALSSYLGRKVCVLEELAQDDADIAWCVATKLPILAAPVVFWSERAQPVSEEELTVLNAGSCRWIVGAETLLAEDDPLTDYLNLMTLIAGAFADVPAVLDVNTTRWHTRRELDEVFASDDVEPPAEVLWIVQSVQRAAGGAAEDDMVWLHTHGLWRCGVPELEMLGVPLAYADPAAELMNDIAALLLERRPPEPGAPMEIGTNLRVALQPWQTIVPRLEDDMPGGMSERTENGDNAHLGARAVICAVPERAHVGDSCLWPRRVTEMLMRDEAGVYMTRRATERQAKLARATWGQLATAFATVNHLPRGEDGSPPIVFGIKAGFQEDDDETSREHLWFEIRSFDADRAEGELVNQPLAVRRLSKGDRVWIEREHISDWMVMTAEWSFGPNDLASLWRGIDELKQRATS